MDLLATRTRASAADAGERAPGGGRVRALLAAALWPPVTGYAVVATLFALVTAIATRSQFHAPGVLFAAAPGWLSAYQVPLQIEGQTLGALPLLPTIAVCLLVARTASSAAQRLECTDPAHAIPVVATMAGAHGVLGLGISLLSNGASVSVEPLTAFLVPALVAGASATAGVARRCGFVDGIGRHLDPLALHGMRAGALGLVALLTAGSLTLLIGTALSVPTVGTLFAENAPGVGSAAGMLLLSLGYVPNAVVLALGFAAGPGFSLGEVALSPYEFTGGPVPGVPLLAAMPEEQASWWPVFVLLPVAAGLLVGWTLRRCHDSPVARLRTVGVAGALVGFGTVVVGTLAGGRLGSGVFDPVSIPLGLVSIATFLWIAVPGGLVAWFAGPRPKPEPKPEPEAAVEPEPSADGGPEDGEQDTDETEVAEADPEDDDADETGEQDEPEDDDFDDDASADRDEETADAAADEPDAEPADEPDDEPADEPAKAEAEQPVDGEPTEKPRDDEGSSKDEDSGKQG
ncbi:cell division protein PerM [Prauserella cavernicola]|uniref:Uncharacterized protein n=1 Tax=Prauserella cavernicola TaxID=2800127 RepID=A0A934V9W6_9PSEU|nr:DUF6350 family protein [Prauserella cavernicola]MBK1789283.1 hypothetical protein [Prauserella cavernicola]